MEKVQGTAAVLHETKVYEDLVEEYGAPVADGLMAKAINNALPSAKITQAHVEGFSKVTRALRTGAVDLQSTVGVAQEKAQKATKELLKGVQSPLAEEITTDRD